MVHDLVDRLIGAVGEDRTETGIVAQAVYQPVGGNAGKVMPPTFPEERRTDGPRKPYLFESRWIDGEKVETVVMDQPPSQANRVEEALLAAHDSGRLELPLFELRVKTERGELRLTSLEFPHRYADAYLRDSEVDGQRFDKSEVGQLLRSVSSTDVRPLYRRDPGSLLFGAWDSHRKGRWPKFPRIYSSHMFGVEPLEGARRGGRLDPINLTGGLDNKSGDGSDWAYMAEGTKTKGTKLSEIGHGNIAPNWAPGGVAVREVRRTGWVSIAALERLRFGDASDEASTLARATLAALALVGDRLAFGRPSLWLRSGCDLARSAETLGFEHAGGRIESVNITVADAIAAFCSLRDQAAKAGVTMETDTIAVTPIPALAEAISYSVTKAAANTGA